MAVQHTPVFSYRLKLEIINNNSLLPPAFPMSCHGPDAGNTLVHKKLSRSVE